MNKKIIKLFVFILIILLIIVVFRFHRNYTNNIEIEKQSQLYPFTNEDCKFIARVSNDEDIKNWESILSEITEIKNRAIYKFMDDTKEKIVFNPIDQDTLTLIIVDNQYSYTSSLEKGWLDEKFNNLLVQKIGEYLIEKKLDKIEIYTVTPSIINEDVPLPPDSLNNL